MNRWTMAALMVMASGCTGSGGDSSEDGALSYETTATTDGGSFVVSYVTDPSPITTEDYFSVTATVYAAGDTSTPLLGAVVEMDADMPGHGHGMNVSPEVTDNGDGTSTGSPFLFHMGGDWRLQLAVTADGVSEVAEMYIDCCE